MTKPTIDWSEEENTILEELYGKVPSHILMKKIWGRSWGQITTQVKRLGLQVRKGNYSSYTEKEDEIIRDNFEEKSYREIAELLKRSTDSVQQRALKIGLRKLRRRKE